MIIKLPSGCLVDLEKVATVSPPNQSGEVYARFVGFVVEYEGADGRALYAAQLARVGNPGAVAMVECLPQRRNPQHPGNCQCVSCSADYAIRVRAEIRAGTRCPKCEHYFYHCDCEETK